MNYIIDILELELRVLKSRSIGLEVLIRRSLMLSQNPLHVLLTILRSR